MRAFALASAIPAAGPGLAGAREFEPAMADLVLGPAERTGTPGESPGRR